ncbi:hypothetical protein FSP39_019948, partial [Pinctada imbricata]
DDIEGSRLLHRLLRLNESLEKQIETLRLRAEYETKRNEKSTAELKRQTRSVIQENEDKLQVLKTELKSRDNKIEDLVTESRYKSEEIKTLQSQITNLNEEANVAKKYVQQLQRDLSFIKEGNGHKEKEAEIQALKGEIESLLRNLGVMEGELRKCRELISSQRGIIKEYDSDKKVSRFKFKEELNKVSATMRLEIERLRDVMKNQWEEMRLMREQNDVMSKDIKDIKQMLVTSSLDFGTHPPQYVHSAFAMVPHLPVLKKDTKRILPGKKKKY